MVKVSRSIGPKTSEVDAETLMTAWEGAARQIGAMAAAEKEGQNENMVAVVMVMLRR
jgi:hypothetical protein